MSELGHAGPSQEPPLRDPLQEDPQQEFLYTLPDEHVAMAKAIPTSNPPVAEVTHAGQSQGVLPEDDNFEDLLAEFTN
jgi:hypothetical protein